MSNINQLPLWCRACEEPWTAFDDEGVCVNCETPNIARRYDFSIIIPVDDYRREDAHTVLQNLVNDLITHGVLPQNTVVLP